MEREPLHTRSPPLLSLWPPVVLRKRKDEGGVSVSGGATAGRHTCPATGRVMKWMEILCCFLGFFFLLMSLENRGKKTTFFLHALWMRGRKSLCAFASLVVWPCRSDRNGYNSNPDREPDSYRRLDWINCCNRMCTCILIGVVRSQSGHNV